MRAAALVAASAIVQGASVVLLIPILSVVMPGDVRGSWRDWLHVPLIAIGAVTPLRQLSLLLTAFLLVAILRAA